MHLNELSSSLPAYMSQLKGKYVPAKDQAHLWEKYKNATDPKVAKIWRDKIYEANLPLVVHFVKKSHARRGNIMDLIQEGNMGLLKAIEKFDPSKGNAFSTYALWWLSAFVNTAAKKMNSPVHVPLNLLRAASIPAQVYTGVEFGEITVPDCEALPDECYMDAEEREIARARVAAVHPYLDSRELYVLNHYILPDEEDAVSLQDIADLCGCSRELVRQWSIKVMQKLRAVLAGRKPVRETELQAQQRAAVPHFNPHEPLPLRQVNNKSAHVVAKPARKTRLDVNRFGLACFIKVANNG